MNILSRELLSNLNHYSSLFQKNIPYKHVWIESFFDEKIAKKMVEDFPKPNDKLLNEFGKSSRKHACHDVKNISSFYREIDEFISSRNFINVVEKISGISGLIYDPEYHGAGTHNNMSGQGMDSHVDFNYHRTNGLHRRLNLIIYLNEVWDEEWGGSIETHSDPWDFRNDKYKSYPPLFNHCLFFETNEYSWHGFEPVNPPKNTQISRKSFTIYFYSKERPAEEVVPKHGTIYVQKGTPENLKAGNKITRKDIDNLDKLFIRRNNYLKALYKRESDLLTQLEFYKKTSKSLKLPVIGDVFQVEKTEGFYFTNNGCSHYLRAYFRSFEEISEISIKGKLPNFIKSNSVELLINKKSYGLVNIHSDETINIPLSVRIPKNIKFEFMLKFLNCSRPTNSNDKREISYLINHIRFHKAES